MCQVLTRGHGHYHVLSPFRGTGPPAYFTASTNGAALDHEVREFCGRWCRFHVLSGPVLERRPMLVLPGGQPDFATVVVLMAGQIRAMLVPRRFTFREFEAFLRRTLLSAGSRLSLPPSLMFCRDLPSMPLALRDGDTCVWKVDEAHPMFQGVTPPSYRHVSRLPHHACWQSSFTVRHGDWVRVWSPTTGDEGQCERHWVHSGSTWLPGSLQFHRPRCLPLTLKP